MLEQNANTVKYTADSSEVLLPEDISNPKTTEHRLRSDLDTTRRDGATHRFRPTKLEFVSFDLKCAVWQ
jgi:hypothetical protein